MRRFFSSAFERGFVAVQDELHGGMALHRAAERGHDNGRAGIASHRVNRNRHFAGHSRNRPSPKLFAAALRLWLPRDRHNGRRRRKYDAGASARRSSGIRYGTPAPGDHATGACCAATATFFFWGPPWREFLLQAQQVGPKRPRPSKARSEQETVARIQARKTAVFRDSAGLVQPLQHGKRALGGLGLVGGRLEC